MRKTKRNRYSAEFKAKVAQAAMREDATLSEIAAKFEIHPNLVGLWKKEAIAGLASVFSGKVSRIEASQEARIKELHEKIGQLVNGNRKRALCGN